MVVKIILAVIVGLLALRLYVSYARTRRKQVRPTAGPSRTPPEAPPTDVPPTDAPPDSTP